MLENYRARFALFSIYLVHVDLRFALISAFEPDFICPVNIDCYHVYRNRVQKL